MKRWIVVAAIALIGCKKSNKEPVTAASGSAPVVTADAMAVAIDAPAEPAWELSSKPVELDCAPPAFTGSYKASLDAGRAAGKAKKWAEAVAAFEHALDVQKDDPAALSELAWATLQVGDAKRSLELAERAIAAATAPNAQAASHFNAARAAEALGDVAAAKAHYEKSLELRPNDAIAERLAKLAAPAPRALSRATPLTACQQQASVDAVCKCLVTSVAEWGKAGGLEGAVSCEPAKEKGTQSQLVVVSEEPADPETTAGGSAIVLVAKRGASWSALQVVETSDEIDRSVTPKASHTAEINAYEERGATIWVETQNEYSETGAGEHDSRGEAGLTICGADGCAARIPLATWDSTRTLNHGEGEDTCEVRTGNAYRATLTSAGVLTLVLAAGMDDGGRAGRYQR
jgi:tetratricopeptide (TPR) repeat protein